MPDNVKIPRFFAIYIAGGRKRARKAGWYIKDAAHTTSHALVIVGNRHETEAAARLEVQTISKIYEHHQTKTS